MSWKPVVVGVDGSAGSARAASVGTMIAERLNTSCTLVYAVPDYEKILSSYGMVTYAREEANRMQKRDSEIVTASLQGFVRPAMLEQLEVRAGRPTIALRDKARTLDAGLIIIGGRQAHGLARFRGSLATHLLRTCEIPVLATSAGPTAIRRILVALDLSYASQTTLDTAREWARAFDARLRVLHVIEPLPVLPDPTIAVSEEYYRADERLRETGPWSQIGEREAEKVVRAGYPATVIAAEADHWRADLVIVGSHGRGWAERILIGSTAEELLLHPTAPTLVVPVSQPKEDRELDVKRLPWESQQPDAAPACSVHQ